MPIIDESLLVDMHLIIFGLWVYMHLISLGLRVDVHLIIFGLLVYMHLISLGLRVDMHYTTIFYNYSLFVSTLTYTRLLLNMIRYKMSPKEAMQSFFNRSPHYKVI